MFEQWKKWLKPLFANKYLKVSKPISYLPIKNLFYKII